MKREDQQKQYNSDSIPKVGRRREEFTISEQNKNAQHGSDKEKVKLFAVIGFKTEEGRNYRVGLIVSGAKNGHDANRHQHKVNPDQTPVESF